MFPLDQVLAHGMSPTHVAPFVALRIVLVEQMILPLEVDHAVRIVHPVFRWGEVKLRSEWLIVGTSAESGCADQHQREQSNRNGIKNHTSAFLGTPRLCTRLRKKES